MRKFRLFLIFGLSTIFGSALSKKITGKFPGPPLPPQRGRPNSPPLNPLLPPVPSQELVDRLTKAQLAFIRQHQEIQRNDKTNYNPYACLPKYICIVESKDGSKSSKRTAVVNGLHPILRENNAYNDNLYQPGKIIVPSKTRSELEHTDPETMLKNQARLDQDTFLQEQEDIDEMAIKRQETELQKRLSKRQSQDSGETDSIEESNEEPSAESGERRIKRPGVVYPSQGQNQTGGVVNTKSKFRLSLPSIIPTMFKSKNSLEPPTLSTPAPTKSIFRRMFGLRGKRSTRSQADSDPQITKLRSGIKSSEQCRILYNGCELTFEQIMQIAEEGQVLIEGDDPLKPKPTKQKMKKVRPAEDDEKDQFVKEKPKYNKGPTIYKIKHKSKVHSGQAPSYNKKDTKKKKPQYENDDGESEQEEDDNLHYPSFPHLPMRYIWGKPQVYVNGKPETALAMDLTGDTRTPTETPTIPTTSAPPTPIFVKKPVYKKANRTITETNIIKLNSTHAFQIKTPKTKPYRPGNTDIRDKDGRPASFASVFTDVAGSSGGIHDYFDKIAKSVGSQPQRRKKQIPPPRSQKPRSPPPRSKRPKKNSDENSEEEEENEEENAHSGKEESEEKDESEEIVKDWVESEDDINSESKNEEENESKEEEDSVKEVAVKNEDKEEEDVDFDKEETPNKPKDKEEEEEEEDEEETPTKPQDKEEDDIEEEETPEKAQDNEENDIEEPPQKGEDKEEDEIEDDDSEEIRKRHKAAKEVELPSFLPESVKQSIRDDIKSGGKSKKKPQPPGPTQPLGDDGDGDSDSHHPPTQHGGQYYLPPPPKLPRFPRLPRLPRLPTLGHGGFFSLLKKPIIIKG